MTGENHEKLLVKCGNFGLVAFHDSVLPSSAHYSTIPINKSDKKAKNKKLQYFFLLITSSFCEFSSVNTQVCFVRYKPCVSRCVYLRNKGIK